MFNTIKANVEIIFGIIAALCLIASIGAALLHSVAAYYLIGACWVNITFTVIAFVVKVIKDY